MNQKKQPTKGAYAIIDGVKITASGRTESEALKNQLEKLKSIKTNGKLTP